jgi:hypothetical protein
MMLTILIPTAAGNEGAYRKADSHTACIAAPSPLLDFCIDPHEQRLDDAWKLGAILMSKKIMAQRSPSWATK